jgi:cell division protein FtsQ
VRGKNAKRAESRARRKTQPAEGRSEGRLAFRHPILAVTLILVAAGGAIGLFAGGHVANAVDSLGGMIGAPFTRAGFAVRNVTIAGQDRTSELVAYGALAIPKGESIFGVRPDAARARLMMLPWVADAEVRRHFPGTVSVRLIEKRPFALWENGKELDIVERSGAVITKVEGNRIGRLPVLAGAGAPAAAAPIVDALEGQKAIMARLVSITRIAERRWDLILTGGVTVRLPEEGWERQLGELERLIVEKGVLERDIEMIDLRYPDNFVFRLHNGDSRPVPRERRA